MLIHLLASLVVLTQLQSPPEANPKPVYDETANGAEQISAALKTAKKDNRRVLVQWGANWCHWCVLLHEEMQHDNDLHFELLYEYELVTIDVGQFNKHQDLIKQYGAAITAIPYLTVLDGDGKVLVNQETDSLEMPDKSKPAHDLAKVLAFLRSYQAPHLVADDVLEDALAQAGREDKRVFLHFGAPTSGWSHRLERWLARPEVATILAKEFVECRIDTQRMTGGAETLTHYRGKSTGIPWFAILDQQGKALADSNADSGNIVFPSSGPEIAHFSGMLRKACANLSTDDIAALERSLVAEREAEKAKPDTLEKRIQDIIKEREKKVAR